MLVYDWFNDCRATQVVLSEGEVMYLPRCVAAIDSADDGLKTDGLLQLLVPLHCVDEHQRPVQHTERTGGEAAAVHFRLRIL